MASLASGENRARMVLSCRYRAMIILRFEQALVWGRFFLAHDKLSDLYPGLKPSQA